MSKKKSRQPRSPNPLLIALAVAAVAIVAVMVIAQVFNRSQAAATQNTIPGQISVAEAAAKRDSGAFILDVRQPEEWAEFHVPDSTLIPLGELASRISEVPRDQEIVVVCRSGNRSQEGRDILLQAGFTAVTSMTGGLREWQAQGFVTEPGA